MDSSSDDFGAGTIVLAADTFALSNEGLREARDPELIAALAGPATHIIFDENHFGVIETGSVTKLMRKYRLEGAVAMLALVAALFLWRSASSLLPPRETRADDAVGGRDSLEGMTALLHRGVAEKELLDTCFAEWSRVRREGRARGTEWKRKSAHGEATGGGISRGMSRADRIRKSTNDRTTRTTSPDARRRAHRSAQGDPRPG